MKHFALVTANVELLLDIVSTLEEGGHSVEIARTAADAMKRSPAPDAIVFGADVVPSAEGLRAWASQKRVALVVVGPAAAEAAARRLGARFIERQDDAPSPAAPFDRVHGQVTQPNPMWPLVLLETLESAAPLRTDGPGSSPDELGPPRPAKAEATRERARHSVRAAPREGASCHGGVGRAAPPRLPMDSVLVVEDDEANRGAIVEVLTESGFRVQSAADGAEALRLLEERARPPGAILFDLMMPRMNGWELQEALAKDPRLQGVPLVVISALAPARELTVAVSAQLHKPLDLRELLKTVENVVERPIRGRHR